MDLGENTMSKELITIGEAMIVFIAENEGDFTDIKNFSKGIAGAELNVSIGLSRLGHKVSYITRLGDDPIGIYIKNFISKENIGTEFITFDNLNKIGKFSIELCFLELILAQHL